MNDFPTVTKASVKVAKKNPPIGGNVEEVAVERELKRTELEFGLILLLLTPWHRGRVARQSSAKACTAVRIRSMPLFYSSIRTFAPNFF